MLLLRLLQKPDRAPRFGRVLDDEPEVVELLDGDPLLGGRPTGERFAYTPKEWQDDPDGSEVELLVPVVPQRSLALAAITEITQRDGQADSGRATFVSQASIGAAIAGPGNCPPTRLRALRFRR